MTIEAGTIAEGTLNPYDLVIRFKSVLKAIWPEKHKEITAMQNDIEIQDLLEECIRALDEYGAQHGLYFGAHEGDGADFGFWPIDSRDEEEYWWATHCSCGAEKEKQEPWLCTSCPPEE